MPGMSRASLDLHWESSGGSLLHLSSDPATFLPRLKPGPFRNETHLFRIPSASIYEGCAIVFLGRVTRCSAIRLRRAGTALAARIANIAIRKPSLFGAMAWSRAFRDAATASKP